MQRILKASQDICEAFFMYKMKKRMSSMQKRIKLSLQFIYSQKVLI